MRNLIACYGPVFQLFNGCIVDKIEALLRLLNSLSGISLLTLVNLKLVEPTDRTGLETFLLILSIIVASLLSSPLLKEIFFFWHVELRSKNETGEKKVQQT